MQAFCLTVFVFSAGCSASLLAKVNGTVALSNKAKKVHGPTVVPSQFPGVLLSRPISGFHTTPPPSFPYSSSFPVFQTTPSPGLSPTPSANLQGVDEDQCQIQRQYTSKPVFCPQKNERFSPKELQESLVQFSKIWMQMQKTFPRSQCCMGVNHRFAIYHTVRSLKPLAIIESGVAAGHTTWLLRQAAGPNTIIFSLDPADPLYAYPLGSGIHGWKDKSNMTRYLTGKGFQDLAFAKWNVLIPDPNVRSRTLVILDDHQSCVERLKMLSRWGFRYAFYEDNYPYQLATSQDMYTCLETKGLKRAVKKMFGDAYTPNTVCSMLPTGTQSILYKDRFGHHCKWLSVSEHGMNVQWMQMNLDGYFEFPPIFTPCKLVARASLMTLTGVPLQQQEVVLRQYGLPSVQQELWHYGHLFPALLELKLVPQSDNDRNVKEAVWQAQAFAKHARAHGEWVR